LTEYIGWRAIFLVNLPLIAVMLVLVGRLLPAGERRRGEPIDGLDALFVTLGLAALIFGLTSGQQHGFGSGRTIAALVSALAPACGFVAVERAVRAPMLPFRIFAAPTRRAAVIAMLLMGGVVAAYVYFISLYLQRVLGFSPVENGLALVPATVTVTATSTVGTRRLLTRFGVKHVLIGGLLAMVSGQLWLSRVTDDDTYAAGVLPGLLVTAFGMGLAFPTASVGVTSGVDAREQGLAGSLFSTSQQVGAAIGLAVLATARTQHEHGSLVAGYKLAFLVGAGGLALAATVVAVLLNARTCPRELDRRRAATELDASTTTVGGRV
jgi:predicted MFS family arabinose efflux permease